ncbi:MAG: GMC family oxidoreductase [Anaerolineae bacterium]
MTITMPAVDAVVIGAGWTGAIISNELAKAGQKVVNLERGKFRDTYPQFAAPWIHDEVRYFRHYELIGDLSKQAVTFRTSTDQTALPMRWYGSFRPGEGTGGAGIHWAGQTWRFLPYDFQIKTQTLAKYGANILDPDITNQDWGVTYDDMEPYYDKFEYLCGTSGKAGNLKGTMQSGGNPFEGPRTRDYPTPPMQVPHTSKVGGDAASGLGYHVFPEPASTISQQYTNPEGNTLAACIYCGLCAPFGCEVGAKASAMTTIMPTLIKNPNYELRTDSYVLKVNLDSTKKKAISVTYLDAAGNEVEQPASYFVLSAFALWNVYLALLSGIGTPYDPVANKGVIGRNYAYQGSTSVGMYFKDTNFNTYMGAGAAGVSMDDLNGDNFDHTGLNFIHGGNVAFVQGGTGPLEGLPTPPNTPAWGSAWKAGVAQAFGHSWGFGSQMSVQSYRGHYVDLDPTYKDAFGRPLLRITFDWGANEHNMSTWLGPKLEEIAKKINPTSYNVNLTGAHYNIAPYQSTHNTGGLVIGTDPTISAVNPWLQFWDVPNVFSASAANFPQNGGYNPTGTVGALAYRLADGLVNKYIKNPGPLA